MGDGGPTKNGYLMQLQSDILGSKVEISQTEELSACGAAFMAGIACGIWDETIQSSIKRNSNERTMDPAAAQKKYSGWKKAVEAVCR
jgi:glycerol kinase